MKSDDIREQPAYTLAEGARYLKVAQATLRSWILGRAYQTAKGTSNSRPLIHPPSRRPPVLSFNNLIEAHVLRALRTDHGVSLRDVRTALEYAQRALNIERLLLRQELRTEAGRVFLERYGQLIDLSASGQLAMRRLFTEHLNRVEWDAWMFPLRLFPFVPPEEASAGRPIAIDPKVAFGRPVVVASGITTRTIAERIDAGETVSELATDYRMTPSEIEQAVLYERVA